MFRIETTSRRPDLAPIVATWLVEAFAAAASVPVLWLYTWTAEPLYVRLGWRRVGLEQDRGQEVVLMTRRFAERD